MFRRHLPSPIFINGFALCLSLSADAKQPDAGTKPPDAGAKQPGVGDKYGHADAWQGKAYEKVCCLMGFVCFGSS